MSRNTITLDELFAAVCRSVKLDQTIVVRGIGYRGEIHGAIEYGVKLESGHPELEGAQGSNQDFDPRAWFDELVRETGTDEVGFTGVWGTHVFPLLASDATYSGLEKHLAAQAARALVAYYLDARIRRERPDVVRADEEHRAGSQA